VAFVTYDAGETLALLPVAEELRASDTEVRWIPLTPWSADLLADHGEPFLPLPETATGSPHLEDRWGRADTGYWEAEIARIPPAVAVSGMVSTVQGDLASRLREQGLVTVGYHDGFQPPGGEAISVQVSESFEEIWVPTEAVREGFRGLGLETAVVGQPSLESWRRAAEDVDPHAVRGRQGLEDGDRVLLFAGQYGPGYEETLLSFLETMKVPLAADPGLILVLSPHPRTEGSLEREALVEMGWGSVTEPERPEGPASGGAAEGSAEAAGDANPRAVMLAEGLSTMEAAVIADAVLTRASTVGTQAAFMGKEVVYFTPPSTFQSDLVDQGTAAQADPSTLGAILSRILERPRSPEVIRQALESGGYVVDADRVVAERIQEVIRR